MCIVESHDSDSLLGTNPGSFRSLHANILGQLVPNNLPTGKKAEMSSQIDLTKAVIALWDRQSQPGMCGRDMSMVDRQCPI